MKVSFEILMPPMPNFLLYKIPPGKRQEGFKLDESNSIPVGELTAEQANEFAEEWKQAFIKHWEHNKKNFDNSKRLAPFE